MNEFLRTSYYVVGAAYWRLRTRGRIMGGRFRLGKPERLLIGPTGSLTLGHNVVIDPGARLVIHQPVRIGSGTYVSRDAVLVAYAPIEIGCYVLIGERVSLHTENHGPPGRRQEFLTGSINIGDETWLAAGVVVLPGVTIGGRSTVGANSVVSRSLGGGITAVGAPARALPRE